MLVCIGRKIALRLFSYARITGIRFEGIISAALGQHPFVSDIISQRVIDVKFFMAVSARSYFIEHNGVRVKGDVKSDFAVDNRCGLLRGNKL